MIETFKKKIMKIEITVLSPIDAYNLNAKS